MALVPRDRSKVLVARGFSEHIESEMVRFRARSNVLADNVFSVETTGPVIVLPRDRSSVLRYVFDLSAVLEVVVDDVVSCVFLLRRRSRVLDIVFLSALTVSDIASDDRE